MANPHFQNLILWAGNNVATKHKKDLPMFVPYPSDQTYYMYHNDFFTYNSGDWTVTTTEAGTGSASEAITSGAGGHLLLTNAAGDNDLDFLQLKGEAFKLSTSKRAYFSARFKVSDVDQSDFVIGLGITDTTPLDTTDGVFFISADGDAGLDFLVEKDNTNTSTEDVATMADDTFITVSFFLDPDRSSQVYYSVNNADPVGVTNANLPDDEELTVSFGIQNGEAAAKTMTIDYVVAAVER
jgi:hypothetical protein|tara:strand:- start:1173 stop:1892 length:720 start_codon:yes stop_codon:yes gene_type:complete